MKQKIIKFLIGIFLIFAFIGVYVTGNFGKIIELSLYDKRFDLRGQREPSKDIVIVAIDNVSMDELNIWPWPRDYHAEIVKNLKSYGAKVVAFDVSFTKPSREPEKDQAFADAIKQAQNVILASMFIGGSFSKVETSSGQAEEAASYTAPDVFEEMLGESIKYGAVNFDRDMDKSIREGQIAFNIGDLMPSSQVYNEKYEPSFALQAIKMFNPTKYKELIAKYKDEKILINFAGPAKTYKTISYSSVLKGEEGLIEKDAKSWSDVFKDKIVLIGANAEILHDNFSTPFTGVPLIGGFFGERDRDEMPGVEIHAALIDTLLNDLEYKKAQVEIDIASIFILGLLSMIISIYLNPFTGTLAIFGTSLIYATINFGLFWQNRLWLDLFGPLAVNIFVFAIVYSYRFFIEEKEKRRVRNVFKRYMSPALVEEALKDPEKIPTLDVCNKKFITVLFSDIAGFTTMSEKFPPEEVKRILDEYLTAMTEIVFNNNGVLDKYIGDAVMAVYGSIGNDENNINAFKTVKTAVEMGDKMKELRKKWVAEGSTPMQIRIGIHSGEALVGNFGSPLKMDYTVIGDTVNTAARLEGLNKEFSSTIMISHSTYELISDMVNVRSLGAAPVKGKSEVLHVYEVLGITEAGKGMLMEDKNSKKTNWGSKNDKSTKWARGTKDTTWK
ncbi:MAG: adenylate/guanylate cyclase domain-containing protein [Candidatus Sericytochromatia bacterium]